MREKPGSTARYVELLVAVGTILTALKVLNVFGGIVPPVWFNFIRWLFHFQFGLFGCATLATLLYALPYSRFPALLRVLALTAFYLWFIWLILWVLVRRAFGIELSFETVVELFTNRSAIAAVGLGAMEFIGGVTILSSLAALLATVSDRIAGRARPSIRRKGFLIFAGLFLLVHLPVRAYIVRTQRSGQAFLTYHDCVPAFLRVEQSPAGTRGDRLALPSLESPARTKAYFDQSRWRQMPAIRRARNIVWINLESFRFDAIEERSMPRLTAYRDEFQIRLDQQHWSGGNATQFGIFSQLTGLSGYQLQNLSRAGMHAPFLTLLASNGYRLRVAKKAQINYAGLAILFPPGSAAEGIASGASDEEDRRMVDRYLEDRRSRSTTAPSFDFLAIDATHWPYSFPKEDAVFQPAAAFMSYQVILGSKEDLASVRNRYRNACHFADAQIARVLDDLKSRDDLKSTIVVIVGDHGEEFEERGQMTHAAVLNDFQARTPLWMHLPDAGPERLQIETPTVHMDIVPTILNGLGFDEDVLYTQGRSLLGRIEKRTMLALSEQGFSVPLYRSLVTDAYVSRWAHRPLQYLFAGVQRRDGKAVEGEAWLEEVRALNPQAAGMFELLPDVSQPPRKFTARDGDGW